MEHHRNWIAGEWAPAARTMTTSNPYTGEAWAEVADDPTAVDTVGLPRPVADILRNLKSGDQT